MIKVIIKALPKTLGELTAISASASAMRYCVDCLLSKGEGAKPLDKIVGDRPIDRN